MSSLVKKRIMIYIIILISIIFIGYVVTGLVFTSRVNSDPSQAEFAAGKFPDPLPDGDLAGSADNSGSWLGKSFDSAAGTGLNRFRDGDKENRTLKFTTYKGKGLTDPNQDVLKLDYNHPENPFYVRFIVDELVEVAPGKYLGKVHLRLLPLPFPFAVQFFRLEK